MNFGYVFLVNSHKEEIKGFKIFKNLKSYFIDVLEYGSNTTIAHSFYEQQNRFHPINRESTLERAQKLNVISNKVKEIDVLNEFCYKFKRA